ncbi:MAG: histidine phosphatase family protein [Gammaproteobacteria bacterium]|nr:histidine phosphatase family protein [Gammaproteobacteria bacterium]
MSRELLVLRHGKSGLAAIGQDDFDRTLTKRGHRATQRMAHWVASEAIKPDAVVSSPAMRTTQTSEIFAAEIGLGEPIQWAPSIYEASVQTLLNVLASLTLVPRQMIVGHNPGMEGLIYLLCAEVPNPPDGNLVPTCALARISLPDDWSQLSPGCGTLLSVTRPRDLEDKT